MSCKARVYVIATGYLEDMVSANANRLETVRPPREMGQHMDEDKSENETAVTSHKDGVEAIDDTPSNRYPTCGPVKVVLSQGLHQEEDGLSRPVGHMATRKAVKEMGGISQRMEDDEAVLRNANDEEAV